MGNLDLGVSLAFWLMVGSAVLCVVYGVLKWNQDKEEPVLNTASWDADEDKINEEL
jgi:hypothetical protein